MRVRIRPAARSVGLVAGHVVERCVVEGGVAGGHVAHGKLGALSLSCRGCGGKNRGGHGSEGHVAALGNGVSEHGDEPQERARHCLRGGACVSNHGGGRKGHAAGGVHELIHRLHVEVKREVVDDGRDRRPEAHGDEEREVGAADHCAARARAEHHQEDHGPEADDGELKDVAKLREGRSGHFAQGSVIDLGGEVALGACNGDACRKRRLTGLGCKGHGGVRDRGHHEGLSERFRHGARDAEHERFGLRNGRGEGRVDAVLEVDVELEAQAGLKGGNLGLLEVFLEFFSRLRAGQDLVVHEHATCRIDPAFGGYECIDVGGVEELLTLDGVLENFGNDAAFREVGERHLAVGGDGLDGEHGRDDALREGDAEACVACRVHVSEGRFERFGEPVGGAGDDGCGPADAERDVLNDLNVGGAHVSHGDVDSGNECG